MSSIDNFGIDGPCTTAWVLKFVFRNGGNFNSRHTKFVSENGLARTDPRVIFHGVISEVMDWLCCVDQVDCTNLVGVEALLREYQLTEEMKVAPPASGPEEHAYFRGKMKTTNGACVCPDLSAWVAERMKNDNEILKQRRKAQELKVLPPSDLSAPTEKK